MPQATPDELLAAMLKSYLPTVFVEGDDDITILRNLEPHLGFGSIDFVGCGGRNSVLEIFKRREELDGKSVAFFADQDLWFFQGVPQEYAEIVFTDGFSIENDLYFDGSTRLNELLDEAELNFLMTLMHNVARWFAFEVERSLAGEVRDFAQVSLLSEKTMPSNGTDFHPEFLRNRDFSSPQSELLHKVLIPNFGGLRGKFLLDCYRKVFVHLRDSKRIQYSDRHLMDLCYREGVKSYNPNSRIRQIITALQAKLQ